MNKIIGKKTAFYTGILLNIGFLLILFIGIIIPSQKYANNFLRDRSEVVKALGLSTEDSAVKTRWMDAFNALYDSFSTQARGLRLIGELAIIFVSINTLGLICLMKKE